MRLGGIAQAAIEVVDAIFALNLPANEALRQWGREHRFAGSCDRAAIGNLVFDALRQFPLMAWALDDSSHRAVIISTLFWQWRLPIDELTRQFAIDGHAPQQLSVREIDLFQTRTLNLAPDHIKCCLPEWIIEQFKASLGENWLDEAMQLAERAPIDLRVNSQKIDRPKALRVLRKFDPQALKSDKDALRIDPSNRKTVSIRAQAGFQRGWFELQDVGSQMAARLCGASSGMQILDYCAGAGGKTLALAAHMKGRGQIFAYDNDPHRLIPIYDRIKKSGAHNIQVISSLKSLSGLMDRVVLDVPCSGVGAWRRRPDTKWRLSPDNLETRRQQQREIIANGATFVKPGGCLIYITCSLLACENGGQIADFVGGNNNFSLVGSDWQKSITAKLSPSALPGQWLLSPYRTASDGFYIAVLRRHD